jgi:NAD(P)-dependent dehydrogenase (short-subunit alcohol dehydrogenase family)
MVHALPLSNRTVSTKGAAKRRRMQTRGIQARRKNMIVTGASQGIGTGVTKAFIEHGYNVVANSRHITKSAVEPTERLAVVEGNIGEASTAAEIADTAMSNFGSIDGVVNNAGIFFTQALTDHTAVQLHRQQVDRRLAVVTAPRIQSGVPTPATLVRFSKNRQLIRRNYARSCASI